MFYPCDNYVFSVPVVFRSKAQCEGNAYSIDERWSVVAKHHRDALWVCLSRPMDCVVPLIKGVAIVCESRLGNCSSTIATALFYYPPSMAVCITLLPSIHGHIDVSLDKQTEHAIITRIEH